MRRALCLAALVLVIAPLTADTPITREQIEAFMRTAKVVGQRGTAKGVTRPLRLTLSDGATTHDALFQAVDERKAMFQPTKGPAEINFVDSWRYNIAAYRLGVLLGLDAMMAPTIEYRHNGKLGSLVWWLDSQMDESERLKKKISPPDPVTWNNDMFRQRVFNELVKDADRNLTNVLVSPDWRVLMVDFTRAFRLTEAIRPAELTKCDRALLARLEALSEQAVTEATTDYLSKWEVTAVMKRRDLIVAHFRQRIQQLGEDRVLY